MPKKTVKKTTAKKATAKKTTAKKATAKKTVKKTAPKQIEKKDLKVNGHEYKQMTFESFASLITNFTEQSASSGRKNFKIFNWTTQTALTQSSTWDEIPYNSDITIEPDDGSGL